MVPVEGAVFTPLTVGVATVPSSQTRVMYGASEALPCVEVNTISSVVCEEV